LKWIRKACGVKGNLYLERNRKNDWGYSQAPAIR
jgi:hypothetical protein